MARKLIPFDLRLTHLFTYETYTKEYFEEQKPHHIRLMGHSDEEGMGIGWQGQMRFRSEWGLRGYKKMEDKGRGMGNHTEAK